MNKQLKLILLLTIAWRLILLNITLLSPLLTSFSPSFLGSGFAYNSWLGSLWPLANFDGAHYLSIALRGYGLYQNAFFPGFPALINLLSRLGFSILTAGLLISNVSMILLAVGLYKLWSLDFNFTQVQKGLLLLLVFPSAFFLGAVYSESLFLLLEVGAFYCARKDKFLLASVLGALATTVRLVGVLLIPALFLLWFKGKRRTADLLAIGLTLTGLFVVMAFNYFQTQDALAFFHVQPLFGAQRSGGQLINTFQVFYRYLKILTSLPWNSYGFFISASEFFFTIISFAALVWLARKMKLEYLIFCLGVLILPTLSGTLSSMPRYILAAFPLFVYTAASIKNKWVFGGLALVLFIWQVISLSLFSNGHWIS